MLGKNIKKGCGDARDSVRMSGIVTDLEGPSRHSTAGLRRSLRLFSRVVTPALVVVVPLSIMLPSSVASATPATPASTAKAEAAQLEQEIAAAEQQVAVLDQQYEAAEAQEAAIEQQISATQAQMTATRAQIDKDKSLLRTAAVEAYVTGGTSATVSPLFAGSQTSAIDSSVYHQVIAGDLTTAVSNLKTATTQLDAERHTLDSEQTQAAQAVTAAQAAYDQAQTVENQEQASLNQVDAQISSLVSQQQVATQNTENTASRRFVESNPPAGGGAGTVAVAAAETQLGVPYVWGGETPGSGFDCSGLVAWAWRQAGVTLPHYSGAQFEMSTPVTPSDLVPGDLLFYGPTGDTHVAMYVGGGQMIEATHPGTVVRIDPVRFGTTFAGAGYP